MYLKIDFTNPFQGRKWLLSLEPSSVLGMNFKKNINLDEKYMGFSFRSNQYGLRGPSNIFAETVICGTSFAMGLSVDNGYNWFDYIKESEQYFNIGLPVGTCNHIRRIEQLYKGNCRRLIYIYHPNIWVTSRNFFYAERYNTDIFSYMGWKVSLQDTILLYVKWFPKKTIKNIIKRYLYLNFNSIKYRIDTKYSYIDLNKDIDFFNTEINYINNLFHKFSEIIVIRVPIKEKLASSILNNKDLTFLNQNFNDNWDIFKNKLLKDVSIIDLSHEFQLNDFLPYDTHWSKEGNKKFYNLIAHIL